MHILTLSTLLAPHHRVGSRICVHGLVDQEQGRNAARTVAKKTDLDPESTSDLGPQQPSAPSSPLESAHQGEFPSTA